VGFGVVQRAGGPCGVLAAVQAHVLEEILFGGASAIVDDFSNPSAAARRHALSRSIARILWRAATVSPSDDDDDENVKPRAPSRVAKLCTLGSTLSVDRTARYAPDGITERLRVWECSTESEVEALAYHRADDFLDRDRGGVLLVLYSALLSRTVALARADGDVGALGGENVAAAPSLIDGRSYASQEAVNLLLFGMARTNVFDGVRTLDDQVQGSSDRIELKGVPRRADLGFLTLDEAYNYYQVGDFLKSPRRPVWIVYSESHYTVLFSLDPNVVDDDACPALFDLFYWDGLGGQDEPIRLTVDRFGFSAKHKPPDPNDPRALIPPLDLVIRTKWPFAAVDWHHTDPIL